MAAEYIAKGYEVKRMAPKEKDFNEDLMIMRKREQKSMKEQQEQSFEL
jgi:hypothetical protein